MSLTLVLRLTNLATTTANRMSTKKFAQEILQAVNSVAYSELNAAKKSFQDAYCSENPERELTITISHSQSAIEHFTAQYNRARNVSIWKYNQNDVDRPLHKIFECNALIAMVYYKLGDRQLTQKYGREFGEKWALYYKDVNATDRREWHDNLNAENEEAKQFVRKIGLTPEWTVNKREYTPFYGNQF